MVTVLKLEKEKNAKKEMKILSPTNNHSYNFSEYISMVTIQL